MHFEELWEKCESFHKDSNPNATAKSFVDELMMKIDFYKAVHQQEIPEEELRKIKERAMGEILLTLTALSLADNINTYEALASALQYRSIGFYNQK